MPGFRIRFFSGPFNVLLILMLLGFQSSIAQFTSVVSGKVSDSKGRPLPGINVAIPGEKGGMATTGDGLFSISIPSDSSIILQFTSIGFSTQSFNIRLAAGETKKLNVVMEQGTTPLPQIEVHDKQFNRSTFKTMDPRIAGEIPNATGSFEAILKTFTGVVSNNELSSQYSVRGGNFDENLVYVNDIEIFRPLLIRSGQQEGLSFIYSDMVSSVDFSAGGFDANYGDKMSSVLDVKYKKPVKFGGSAYASLLGGGFHLEGVNKNKKINYLLGSRYKSSKYLFKSLETKGEYKPVFGDIQGMVNWKTGKTTELSLLGNWSSNIYNIIPANRQTEFGTINEALRLTIYFDGQEIDRYKTGTAAISFNKQFNDSSAVKLIGSYYRSDESESFDIMGQYYIDELEKDLGSDNFGQAAFNLGIGTYIEHARNQLYADIYSFDVKGYSEKSSSRFQYGLQGRYEIISDKLSEWQYVDSAEYSLPHPPDNVGGPANPAQSILMQEVIKTDTSIASTRLSSYLMNSWLLGKKDEFTINAGIRFTYRTLNDELLFSPRASFRYDPANRKNLSYRFASGVYYQPPFYREMRNYEGQINTQLKSQESIHFIAGVDYTFLSWGREFKFVSEVYYKILKDLVPYKVDNLRLRYFAKNNSSGYAAGADFRVNGEFVEGIESWASLSFLKTEEDISDDYYYTYFNSEGQQIIPGYTFNNIPTDSIRTEPGKIARPTDQRVTFSIFFQDYLPKFPSYRMNMTLVYGTGLPFGPPGSDRYKDKLRYPSYRRVDIGFSKTIIDEDSPKNHRMRLANKLDYFSIGIDVFNLLQVNNTVSYLWVTDVTDRTYAVPNYLSARTLNIKATVRF